MSLLSVEGLGIQFGGLHAVRDVSFSLKAGEIVSVIGPNGAGKTTLFNMISGIYLPQSGAVRSGTSGGSSCSSAVVAGKGSDMAGLRRQRGATGNTKRGRKSR